MNNTLNLLLTRIMTHQALQSFWHLMFKLSLRGMGVLNAGSDEVTGEEWFIEKLSKTKLDTVFDVGANTTVFGKDQLRANVMHAFEPHPIIFKKYLSKTPKKTAVGTKIILHNIAIGSVIGTTKLWDFAEDAELKNTQPTSTLASVNKQVIEQLHKQKAHAFEVPCITLDHFAQQHNISQISLLKIDVEGYELEVLRGAKKLLKKNAIELIQFEFNQMHVYQNVFFRDLADALNQYQLYRLSCNGLIELASYSPVTHELFAFQNILAIHKHKKEQWLKLLR